MLLGVTGKSAQIPLYVWLPDAMAGPTPVSALIHAATMVTAGVYLVARSNPLYSAAPTAQAWVAWVGAVTALFAATIAVGQFDIKKVLAYSTISQLGFMVAAVGMGAYTAGMFHLITHAFFKALLFLSAGSVILGMERGQEAAYGHKAHGHASPGHGDFDPQDMRNMGGLRSKMPVTFWVYLIGALALAGIAPLSGFFSKDEILAAASEYNRGILLLLILAAFLTAFYMGRQILMVFFGTTRTRAAGAANENSPVITIPLIILAILAVLWRGSELARCRHAGHWLEHTIDGVHEAVFNPLLAGRRFWSPWWAFLPPGCCMAASPAAPVRRSSTQLRARAPALFKPLANAWGSIRLTSKIFVRGYTVLSDFLAGPVDQGLIDGIVNGFGVSRRSFFTAAAPAPDWLCPLVRADGTGRRGCDPDLPGRLADAVNLASRPDLFAEEWL